MLGLGKTGIIGDNLESGLPAEPIECFFSGRFLLEVEALKSRLDEVPLWLGILHWEHPHTVSVCCRTSPVRRISV